MGIFSGRHFPREIILRAVPVVLPLRGELSRSGRNKTERGMPVDHTSMTGDGSQEEFLNTYGLADMDAREIIDHLDQQPVAERPTDLIASVRTDELVLTDQDQEVTLDLPENLTYVSIAPYLTQTHDCFYHSLTTCLGELSNEPVEVTFTDETTGEVLVNEQSTTFDNGFAGFWVPRGATGTIEATYQDRSGVTEFSTTKDGATCVTDLRLT